MSLALVYVFISFEKLRIFLCYTSSYTRKTVISARLAIVATVTSHFSVRYCSRNSNVHWKITQLETTVIVTIAIAASVLIKGTAQAQKPQPVLNEGVLFESAIKWFASHFVLVNASNMVKIKASSYLGCICGFDFACFLSTLHSPRDFERKSEQFDILRTSQPRVELVTVANSSNCP